MTWFNLCSNWIWIKVLWGNICVQGSNGVSLRKSSFAKVQIIAKVHLTVARVFLSLLVSLLENNVNAKKNSLQQMGLRLLDKIWYLMTSLEFGWSVLLGQHSWVAAIKTSKFGRLDIIEMHRFIIIKGALIFFSRISWEFYYSMDIFGMRKNPRKPGPGRIFFKDGFSQNTNMIWKKSKPHSPSFSSS